MTAKLQPNPFLKFVLDFGPLVLFFLANWKPTLFEPYLSPIIPTAVATGEHAGIFVATAVFVVASVVTFVISFALTRRLPVMTLVSGIVVLAFGGATLYFQNETFIKIKPTIIYAIFAVTLFGGLIFNKPVLAIVFDQMFNLTEEGWRKLTLRWGLFFVGLAVLNEIIWRTQSTNFWVAFKAFGAIPLTFIFAMFQYPLLTKHDAGKKDAPPPSSG